MGAIDQPSEGREPPAATRWICPERVLKNLIRAQQAIERAQEVCREAERARAAARAKREEARRLRLGDPGLPLFVYDLPSLAAARAHLRAGQLPGELEGAVASRRAAWRAARCILYVWGYDCFPDSLGRSGFVETEPARQFAAARGWDGGRPGAWAGEQALAMSLSAAMKAMEFSIRGEPTTAGWGGKSICAV